MENLGKTHDFKDTPIYFRHFVGMPSSSKSSSQLAAPWSLVHWMAYRTRPLGWRIDVSYHEKIKNIDIILT